MVTPEEKKMIEEQYRDKIRSDWTMGNFSNIFCKLPWSVLDEVEKRLEDALVERMDGGVKDQEFMKLRDSGLTDEYMEHFHKVMKGE